MRFSLGNQLVSLLSGVTWESAPLLIGFMLGPAGVSTYQIGRKFPAAVAALLWPIALVMFPAAGEIQRAADLARAAEALETGTRWLMVIVLPLCMVMWIVAPSLLNTWLRTAPAGSLPVFRLMTIAVTANAACFAAVGVLLGRGAIASTLRIACIQAAAVISLTGLLLYRIGVPGAAWALVLVTPLSSAAILLAAAGRCEIVFSELVPRIFAGLLVPIAACTVATSLIMYVCQNARWSGIVSAVLGGMLVYAITFFAVGADEQEQIFLRQGVDAVRSAGALCRIALRTLARRLRPRTNPHPGGAGK